jgi:hypothetical protein
MSQPVFPTLTIDPVEDGFSQAYAYDNRISTTFEDGKMLTMKRYTDVPLTWVVNYHHMSATDLATLMEFYEDDDDADWGNTPIKWTNPVDSVAYFVYFNGPPEFMRESDDSDSWRVIINFLEALGTYT